MQVELDFEPVVVAVAAAAVLAAVLVELVGVAAVEMVKMANGEFVSAAVIAVVVVAAAVAVCVFFSLFFSRIHWSKTIENSYPLLIHGFFNSIFSAKFSIEMLTIYYIIIWHSKLKTAILYRIFDDSKKVSNQISIGKA